MKKLFFILSVLLLLAVGCNNDSIILTNKEMYKLERDARKKWCEKYNYGPEISGCDFENF